MIRVQKKYSYRRYRGHTPAGEVKVIDARTGEVVRIDRAYNQRETRKIVGRAGRGKDPP